MWFLGTMLWGCVTNNVIMLYVAIEATTLTSGLLVAFYWDRRALEAGYKYLMLLTIGITFALFGCVLLYAGAAATDKLAGASALLISNIRNVAQFIPSGTAAITIAFLVIGFGTKAGIAPFHPWLPDAHAEAPTPISVLLSGVMIKMALYAMARTVSIFYPAWPQVTIFLVALGAFTMLLGIILALTQDDLKRLLAYSSVSQMGYVLVGIGLGTYLGCYGGLYHLLNHAIYKSLLFMCVGAVMYATGHRRISELGGLRKQMPITSACFFLGALAIAGFPPLNGFWSKLTVYLALAQGRAVVGGGHCRRGEYFDHGRYGAGGVQSVLGRARLEQHLRISGEGSAGPHVGPHGVFGGNVRIAWNLPPNAIPAARSRGGSSGHPGKVRGANMLKESLPKGVLQSALGVPRQLRSVQRM